VGITFYASIDKRRGSDGRMEIAILTTVCGIELDRYDIMGYVVGPRHMALAKRLKKAIEAGAVFTPKGVKKDIYGETYLDYTTHVLGRRMNADLKRLGF
jgi:hypothetical protein